MPHPVGTKRTLAVFILAFVSAALPAHSGQKLPGFIVGESISIGTEMAIQSAVYGRSRTVLVSVPEGYADGEKRYAVIYLTDASVKRLGLLRAIVDIMAGSQKIPDMIIVGIVQVDRNEELTPGGLPGIGSEASGSESPPLRKGDRLLGFMKHELIPTIESRYRTLPSRIYVGHSRGGLFGVYCLLKDPALFNAQIDVDPSIWWNDGALIAALGAFLKGNPDVVHSLVVSETREMERENGAYFVALKKVLEGGTNPFFRYGFMELAPAESHDSSVLPTLVHGLQVIFKDYSELDFETLTLDGFRAHFAKPILGAVYDLTEEMIDGFGQKKLMLKKYADAVAAFTENAQLHPNSAGAFYRLGEAYFRMEMLPESLLNLEKAVELGTRQHDPKLRTYISNRNTVRDLLGKKESPWPALAPAQPRSGVSP